ncbi:MAG: efflux RND transporter periplasmic adaptor subunit [Halieaceae bacterium]|jgi:RND family efflux transporter MFP subunit|nr:efflux RND transporter periplasmic adaptor subunit [Halieaceae bacterium]
MNAKNAVLALAALGGLLVLIAFMAGLFNDRIEPRIAEPVAAQGTPAYRAAITREAIYEAVPASVEARETTILAARLLGRIEAISVRAGDYVEAGQLLLRLQADELEARAGQAEQGVRSLEARLEEARQTLERTEELHGRQLLADAQLDAARANTRSLEAELAAARQRLAEARTALAYTQIQSPMDGRVVDRFAEPGDTVSPGQKILSLYNPFSLRVEAWVRESLALQLTEGQSLRVLIPALDRDLQARIEEIVPAADPGSRSFLVKATLSTEPGLLPGMYATVEIPAGERELMLVPEDLIARVGQLDVAWVQAENGVQRRFLRLGEAGRDGLVQVAAGLAAGDALLPPPD